MLSPVHSSREQGNLGVGLGTSNKIASGEIFIISVDVLDTISQKVTS